MERTFFVPLAAATALHVGVLFGLPRGALPRSVSLAPAVWLKAFALPPPLPPDEDDVMPNDDPAPAPGAVVPRSAETFVPMPLNAFEIPPVPAVEATVALHSLRDASFVASAVGAVARNAIIGSNFLDTAPHTRAQVAPVYPSDARRTGLTGRVLVEFVVDEQGRVVDPRVMISSDRVFEEATLRAIARWRFEPGRKDGRVVRFRMAVPVEFNLNE